MQFHWRTCVLCFQLMTMYVYTYIYIYCIYIVNVPTPPVIQVGNGQSTMVRSFSAFAQTCGCPIASSAIFDFWYSKVLPNSLAKTRPEPSPPILNSPGNHANFKNCVYREIWHHWPWMWDYNSYNSQAGTQTTSEMIPHVRTKTYPIWLLVKSRKTLAAFCSQPNSL